MYMYDVCVAKLLERTWEIRHTVAIMQMWCLLWKPSIIVGIFDL